MASFYSQQLFRSTTPLNLKIYFDTNESNDEGISGHRQIIFCCHHQHKLKEYLIQVYPTNPKKSINYFNKMLIMKTKLIYYEVLMS